MHEVPLVSALMPRVNSCHLGLLSVTSQPLWQLCFHLPICAFTHPCTQWRKKNQKKTPPTSLKHNSGLLNHTFLRPACEADRPAADSAHVVSDSLFYTHSTLQIYGCDVLARCSLRVQRICYRCLLVSSCRELPPTAAEQCVFVEAAFLYL